MLKYICCYLGKQKKGVDMQKRGGGRFGKYGDLKRKEKIRQTRLFKLGTDSKPSTQRPMMGDQKKGRQSKPNVEAGFMVMEKPKVTNNLKTEDVK